MLRHRGFAIQILGTPTRIPCCVAMCPETHYFLKNTQNVIAKKFTSIGIKQARAQWSIRRASITQLVCETLKLTLTHTHALVSLCVSVYTPLSTPSGLC